MRSVDVSSNDGAQGIITHGVAVIGASQRRPLPELHPRHRQRRAAAASTAPATPTSLLKSLLEIFNEIQAVNSVFASASLPVSVNARGTYLNQVYMGMFRPDGDAKPALARQPEAVQVRARRGRHAVAGRRQRQLGDQRVDGLHQPERRLVLDHAERLLEPTSRSARRRRRATRRTARSSRRAPRRSACASAYATSQTSRKRADLRRLRRRHGARRDRRDQVHQQPTR